MCEVQKRSNSDLDLSIQESKYEIPKVLVEKSSDVQIGSRLNYNGPVTINQYGKCQDLPDITYVTSLERKKKENEDVSDGKRRALLWVCGLLLIIILVSLVIYFATRKSEKIKYVGVGCSELGDHCLYSRNSWRARPAKFAVPLKHPVPVVVISANEGDSCTDYISCSQEMRDTQQYDMYYRPKGGQPDIVYNFMIGGDGNMYEGRGWDVQSYHEGAEKVLGISFIGDYNYDKLELNEGQIDAAKELIKYGVELGKIDKNYRLVAHNQVHNTNSPGGNVLEEIRHWPHWDPTFQIVPESR